MSETPRHSWLSGRTGQGSSTEEQLDVLETFHQRGVLSDEDYEAAKAKVLSEAPVSSAGVLGTTSPGLPRRTKWAPPPLGQPRSRDDVQYTDGSPEGTPLVDVSERLCTEARFGSAYSVSRFVIALAWVLGPLGVIGSIYTGARLAQVRGLTADFGVLIVVGGLVSSLVLFSLLACAGYGLRVLLATWYEAWERQRRSIGPEPGLSSP